MYKEYFGFSADPFSLNPDPDFLYLARSHREALYAMMSGIQNRKGMVLITGEVGAGKTILIYTVLKSLSEKIKSSFIFNPKLDFKDLLKSILKDLDIPIRGEKDKDNVPTLMLEFRNYLKERVIQDETVAVVIDEAQSMDEEVLADLFRFFSLDIPATKVLQVLLVGQPELETKLNSEKLRPILEKIAIHRQIHPLTREEGRGYVGHRLKVVGRSVSEVFTSDAVNRIWEFAGGIPRVINLLCDRALLIGYTDSKPIIDSLIVNEAIKNYEYLRPAKDEIPQPEASRVKSHYKTHYRMIGLWVLLLIVLGVYAFLHRDLIPPAWKRMVQIPFPEERPLEKGKEEILEKKIPAAEEPALKKQEEIWVEVKKGGTLLALARQYYPVVNHSLLDFILEANPQITDSNLIFPNQKIKIPNITEEAFLLQISDHIYNIHLGAFKSAKSVHLYTGEPLLRGKKITVIPRKVSPRETLYRIEVGRFNTKDEALKAIQILKEKKKLPLLDCLPRKTP
jgi:general secretion pathway protein A